MPITMPPIPAAASSDLTLAPKPSSLAISAAAIKYVTYFIMLAISVSAVSARFCLTGSPVIRWLFCSRCISRRTPLVISIASSAINAMFIMLVTKPSPFSLSSSSTAFMNSTIVFRLRAARMGSFPHYYSNACAL